MINSIASTAYARTLNLLQPETSSTDASSPSANATSGDRVEISTEAKSSLISSLFPNAGEGPISLSDIEEALSDATSSVEKRLRSLYGELGIPYSSRMEMSVGYDGKILVSGDGPEADRLAETINADDELANTIRGMSANASLLEAAKKGMEFSAAYAEDPRAAVERYGYLLEDDYGYDVTFSVLDGRIDIEIS